MTQQISLKPLAALVIFVLMCSLASYLFTNLSFATTYTQSDNLSQLNHTKLHKKHSTELAKINISQDDIKAKADAKVAADKAKSDFDKAKADAKSTYETARSEAKKAYNKTISSKIDDKAKADAKLTYNKAISDAKSAYDDAKAKAKVAYDKAISK